MFTLLIVFGFWTKIKETQQHIITTSRLWLPSIAEGFLKTVKTSTSAVVTLIGLVAKSANCTRIRQFVMIM